jgi:putative membrane protein
MRVVLWCCRIFIFLFLLAFALKNTEPVSVSFFFETSWHAPLIIVVLAFFAGGVALGILALLGTIFGLKREISRLKRGAKATDSHQEDIESVVPRA